MLAGAHFSITQHDDDKARFWNLEGAAPGFSMNLCLKPVHGRVIITR
jgi:hypothetical protein